MEFGGGGKDASGGVGWGAGLVAGGGFVGGPLRSPQSQSRNGRLHRKSSSPKRNASTDWRNRRRTTAMNRTFTIFKLSIGISKMSGQ
jgi:hypothetical protein